MKKLVAMFAAFMLVAMPVALTGCEEEEPTVDDAMKEVQDAAKEAADEAEDVADELN